MSTFSTAIKRATTEDTGQYYTPEKFAMKALEHLDAELGVGWEEHYVIYDPACGSGNLAYGLRSYKNLFMSTLEQGEVDYINHENLFPGATVFQFNFLNDPLEKMPTELLQKLSGGKVVVLMNSLFAEATSGIRTGHKSGVAKTQVKRKAKYPLEKMPTEFLQKLSGKIVVLMNPPLVDATSGIRTGYKPWVAKTQGKLEAELGAAGNELPIQFLWRLKGLAPNAVLGVFSKLNLIESPKAQPFREIYKWGISRGFVFPASVFVGVTGKWLVAFSVLKPGGDLAAGCEYLVLDADGGVIGRKYVRASN